MCHTGGFGILLTKFFNRGSCIHYDCIMPAVETTLKFNESTTTCGSARYPNSCICCFRAGVTKKDFLGRRDMFDELLRQSDFQFSCPDPNQVDLLRNFINVFIDLWMTVA